MKQELPLKILSSIQLKTKVIIGLVVILIPYSLLISFKTYQTERKAILSIVETNILPLITDNIYKDIQKYISHPLATSSIMANDTFVKDWAMEGEQSPDKIAKFLRTIRSKYRFFSTFYVSAKTKKYYYHRGILKRISKKNAHDQWFYKFIKGKGKYEIEVDSNKVSQNTPTLFINRKIYSTRGKILGVTGVGLKLDELSKKLRDYGNKYHCNVFFSGTDGKIKVHRNIKKIGSLCTHCYHNQNLHPMVEKQQQRYLVEDTEKGTLQIFVKYTPEFKWNLIVEITDYPELTRLKERALTLLIINLIISMVTIIFAAWVVNFFQKKIIKMAITDSLTKTYNRNELLPIFEQYRNRLSRHGIAFSLIMIDIDDFKDINDTLGHIAGDNILREVSRVMKNNIRTTDSLFRYGGDEFVIIFEGEISKAKHIMTRIRSDIFQIKNASLLSLNIEEVPLRISLSCGIAQYINGDTLNETIIKADEALYSAKRKGKDRTELYKTPKRSL